MKALMLTIYATGLEAAGYRAAAHEALGRAGLPDELRFVPCRGQERWIYTGPDADMAARVLAPVCSAEPGRVTLAPR